jgi:serine/threonine protein kinase
MFFALRLWLGERTYGVIGNPKFPAGYRISSKRVVKWPCEQPELDGHRFALANTDLPVFRIYSARTWRNRHAITMEYMPDCKTVQECWHTLSSGEKQEIVVQVSGYIQQLRSLRSLRPPLEVNGRVSATKGGACRDVRVSSSKLFGPFDDVAGFHRCLRGGVETDGVHEIFGEKVANVHSRPYAVRFTHGDLGPQNILVRGSKVVAIIDWECSGFYPEYWEYTKAHYNSALLPEFYEMLRRHLFPRYDDDELAAERILWRSFDQPLDTSD